MTITGGCHCGAVRFEVLAPAEIEVSECNCSICSKAGYLHLIVARERFRLLQGEQELASYRFGSGTARHLFCRWAPAWLDSTRGWAVGVSEESADRWPAQRRRVG